MCRMVPSSLSLCSDCSISAAPEKLRWAGRGASHASNDAPRRSLTPKLRMCLHILAKWEGGAWGGYLLTWKYHVVNQRRQSTLPPDSEKQGGAARAHARVAQETGSGRGGTERIFFRWSWVDYTT